MDEHCCGHHHDKDDCVFLKNEKCLPTCEVKRNARVAICSTLAFLIQTIAIIITDNLALKADTIHALSDSLVNWGSVLVAWVCLKNFLSERGVKIWQIFFACLALLLLCTGAIHILYESYERFCNPVEIKLPGLLLVAASIGLYLNRYAHDILHAVPHECTNPVQDSLHAHVDFDMWSSVAVVFSIVLIILSTWMEAIFSLVAFDALFFIVFVAGLFFCFCVFCKKTSTFFKYQSFLSEIPVIFLLSFYLFWINNYQLIDPLFGFFLALYLLCLIKILFCKIKENIFSK